MTRVRAALGAVLVAGLVATGCAGEERAVPTCTASERMGLVAQAVPGAAYVPCVAELPAGWSVGDFDVRNGHTSFLLRSDRADAPVRVRLAAECATGGATAVVPRDEGVRTLQLVTGIAPAYAGVLYDVFPGGCITYRFEFERGPHLTLLDELQAAVDLYPRRQLRQDLLDRLGVDIDS